MSKGWQKGKKATAPRNVRRILVICEDSKSSRDYFSSFPVDSTRTPKLEARAAAEST